MIVSSKVLVAAPIVGLVWMNEQCISAFQPLTVQTHQRRSPHHHQQDQSSISLNVVELKDKATAENDSYTSSSPFNGGGGGGGGLLLANDAKSQLFASFSALSLADQYDAVLTGLCAKIVDNNNSANDDADGGRSGEDRLTDPIQLLQEMNDKRITASPRSMMALIDATVKVQEANTLATVMSMAMRNGGVTSYGSCLPDIMALPSTPQTRVKCPDGSVKTRQERLDSVPPLPTDERVAEVGSALTVVAIAGGCELTDFISGLQDVAPAAHVILTAMITIGVLDNFYDVIKTTSSFAMQQVNKPSSSDNSNKKTNNINLPELPSKESLPLGLGSGEATGQIVRGLTRLLTIDPARDALAEAAGLFAAYSLGLPVFCFRPNALEASVLAVENNKEGDGELLSDTGLLRLLVWLLAPVAAESAQYPVLISSDPREAGSFLDRLQQVAATNGPVANALWWLEDNMEMDEEERNDLLQWAYTEADVLLRDNQRVVRELAERLEGGAATIGDCIALLEQW